MASFRKDLFPTFSRLLVCHFVLIVLFSSVEAQWETPPIELVEDGLENISIIVDDGGSYIIEIQENVGSEEENGFYLVKLKPTDPEKAITKITGDSRFIPVSDGGEWFLKATTYFDYDILPSPTFALLLESGGSYQFIQVEVLDVNDEEPRVESMVPNPVPPIKELQFDNSKPVLKINAVDDDKADTISFLVYEDDKKSEYFDINSDGEIFLIKALDYAERNSHRLNVSLSDDREPFHVTYFGVTILVEDVPNLPPEFTRPPVIRSVIEEQDVDTLITTVQARDGDYGVNWGIEYYIDDTLDLLKIDLNTGEIKVNRRIDAESPEFSGSDLTHTITVTAKEKPHPEYPDLPEDLTTKHETVTFSITDINDNPPSLCNGDADDSCDKAFRFEIEESHTGQITMDKEIRVVDLDSSTNFNSFNVAFAPGTDPIIEKAFNIAPTRGSKEEIFSLSVLTQSTEWIDVENDALAGFWLQEHTFEIQITGTENNTHQTFATITAKVIDINDNSPEFVFPPGLSQYEFNVCENTPGGTRLRNVIAEASFPDSCPSGDSEDWEDINVRATDKDANPAFGDPSVRYRWSQSTREPPVVLGWENGSMTMDVSGDFDYERFQTEVFILEAMDYEGESRALVNSVPVTFKILDKNDVVVDLRLTNGSRATIKENTTMNNDEFVLNGIVAKDDDTKADVTIEIDVNTLYTRERGSNNYRSLDIHDDFEEEMKKWFKLEYEDGGTPKEKRARIVLGDVLPDREGNPNGDIVDRVDLLITAQDCGVEPGEEAQISTQVVTVLIEDINDNPPRWADDGDTNLKNLSVVETEEWGEEGDTSLPYQREIYTFRATDPDTDTRFEFSFGVADCQFPPEICAQLNDLFELSNTNPSIGTAVLRRKEGKLIDREFPYISGYDDKINLTIIVSDGLPEHNLEAAIEIHVEDRNDNTPVFKENYNETVYFVNELVDTEALIETIIATDEDHPAKFGNVSYLLVDEDIENEDNNGMEEFNIDLVTGQLTAIPNSYDWFDISQFRIRVKAIDYYRSSSQSGSNFRTMYILINVADENNHPPEFLTPQGGLENPLVEMKEREADPDEPFPNGITIQDKDDPSKSNGEFTVRIESVAKSPSRPNDPEDLKELFRLGALRDLGDKNKREVFIYPQKNLTGLWGTYTIKLQAIDGVTGDQHVSPATYVIIIENENLNAPRFIYPEDNSTSIPISIISSKPGMPLEKLLTNEEVPNVYAEDDDKEDGDSGIVTYSLEPHDPVTECVDLFSISDVFGQENITGFLTLTKELDSSHANKLCRLLIKASDKGTPPQASFATIDFLLLNEVNTPPAFPSSFQEVLIQENTTDSFVVFQRAIDTDIESGHPYFENDTVYYMLKGGDKDIFDLRIREDDENGHPIPVPSLVPTIVLDYEDVREYKVSVYATNIEDENVEDMDPDDIDGSNSQWIAVTVKVTDRRDTAPKFRTEGVISGGCTPIRKVDDVISTIWVDDPDEDDPVSFEIVSGFSASDGSLPTNTEPFELGEIINNDRAIEVILRIDIQPAFRGYYQFLLVATDSVGMTAEAICQMYMVRDSNIVKFYLFNQLTEVREKQDKLARTLSTAFQYSCNIDRVVEDGVQAGVTTVETHFINLIEETPVPKDYIIQQQYTPGLYKNLTDLLREDDLVLAPDGIGGKGEEEDTSNGQLVTYFLIGGVAVMTITLLIVGASCYYNNRSLSRRVRALTATTFGSQKSDLNRLGAIDSAPNTNAFAIEGSNPIWTVENDTKKFPEFDTESVGSGGSVLIGAEDEDYFQKSKSSRNPMFQADDVVGNYDSENDVPEKSSYDYNYDDSSDPTQENPDFNNSTQNIINNASPFTTKTTRNPLMNLGAGVSVDVDAAESEPEQDSYDYDFEQNTDGTLF